MFITLCKIGGMHLLDTNGFHVKAKNERFTTASSRCHQNLKYKNFMLSFSRLRQNIGPKSVPHVQHNYFSSFNQANHRFVVLLLMLQSSNLKLSINGPDVIKVKAKTCSQIFLCARLLRAHNNNSVTGDLTISVLFSN